MERIKGTLHSRYGVEPCPEYLYATSAELYLARGSQQAGD
jgi:hypothetical protein